MAVAPVKHNWLFDAEYFLKLRLKDEPEKVKAVMTAMLSHLCMCGRAGHKVMRLTRMTILGVSFRQVNCVECAAVHRVSLIAPSKPKDDGPISA